MGLVSHMALLHFSVHFWHQIKLLLVQLSETSYSTDFHSHFRISADRNLHLVELDSFELSWGFSDRHHRHHCFILVCLLHTLGASVQAYESCSIVGHHEVAPSVVSYIYYK